MIHYHKLILRSGDLCCASINTFEGRINIAFNSARYCKTCSISPREHNISNDSSLQKPFAKRPKDKSLVLAIQSILTTDAHAEQQFKKGMQIVRQIASENPIQVYKSKENTSISSYNQARRLSDELIRPLFLPPPQAHRLRPFQLKGIEWLLSRKYGILADDMGLGKTVQAITALRILFHEGVTQSALILCPKSLIPNWEHEFAKWAPELIVFGCTPNSSIRQEVWKNLLGKVHILITNYEQIRVPPKVLIEKGVGVLIADEAHRIRNFGSQISSGIREIKWDRFYALTGTPIERDENDLITLLATFDPWKFPPNQKHLHASILRSNIRPYLLRRNKTAVLKELPSVIENKVILDLLPSQKKSYDRAVLAALKASDTSIFAEVNELRKICDYDPKTKASCKVEKIMELIEDIYAVGEKVIVFSYFIEPLKLLSQQINNKIQQGTSLIFSGELDGVERENTLKKFKTNSSITALLCSTRIAGEGLTLTEANHVIFFNLWWNPSSNLQARDRVVRIGQNKVVNSYSFLCRDTIEELLDEILEQKTKINETVVEWLAKDKEKQHFQKNKQFSIKIKKFLNT